jgi:hypothetical protein
MQYRRHSQQRWMNSPPADGDLFRSRLVVLDDDAGGRMAAPQLGAILVDYAMIVPRECSWTRTTRLTDALPDAQIFYNG